MIISSMELFSVAVLILNRLEQVKLNIVLIIVLIQQDGEVAHSLEICK